MLSFSQRLLREAANRFLQRAIPCHLATTQRERDAIARLRYEVHIREQNVRQALLRHFAGKHAHRLQTSPKPPVVTSA